jgi:hypothetical protein
VPSGCLVNRGFGAESEAASGAGGRGQRLPRRPRELKVAAVCDPARAASSARVRAGPAERPDPPRPDDDELDDDAVPEPPEEPDPPRRRRP